MQLKKLAIKIPFVREDLPASDRWIELMNVWIRDNVIPGTLIDVADYTHMVDGPGIVLVAHEYILSLDHQNGWSGLRIAARRDAGKASADELKGSLQVLSKAADSLAKEFDLQLDTSRMEITALDRLNEGSSADFIALAEEVLGCQVKERGVRNEKELPGVDLDLTGSFSLQSYAS